MKGKLAELALIHIIVFAVTGSIAADNPYIKIFNELHKEPGPKSTSQGNVRTLWIEQKLDHFDPNNTKTWQMRYLVNDEFFRPAGPIFVIVGGEWTISPGLLSTGFFYDLAKIQSACLFYTEHRFYGESRPVDAMTNENLKYLSADQAIADLDHFVRFTKRTNSSMIYSKVTLVGLSYSGSLVKWLLFMQKTYNAYTFISSAPFKAIMDFSEYKHNVGQAILLKGGHECYKRIERGINQLESMFYNKRGAEVKAMLKLCQSFHEDNDFDMFTLFFQISEVFSQLVQNHDDGDIERACSTIMEGWPDAMGLAKYILEYFDTKGCNDLSYDSYLSLFNNTSFNAPNGISTMRAWFYQTCNDFGWFPTSSDLNQPFGKQFPLVFFTSLCADIYGDKFTRKYIEERVKKTNKKYGGLWPLRSNYFLRHGELDPWISASLHDERHSDVIPDYTHCKDLDSISETDSPQLRRSKQKLVRFMGV